MTIGRLARQGLGAKLPQGMDNPLYQRYLQSREWDWFRTRIIQMDGRCCRCWRTDRVLQVHHIDYTRIGAETLLDCLTLCIKCHEKADQDRKRNRLEHTERCYLLMATNRCRCGRCSTVRAAQGLCPRLEVDWTMPEDIAIGRYRYNNAFKVERHYKQRMQSKRRRR